MIQEAAFPMDCLAAAASETGHSFATRAVHGGREDLRGLGVHAPPIDLSSTYPIQDLALGGLDLENMAMGGHPQTTPVYSRLHNPTVARFEKALAQLERMAEAVAFSSGMAAVTAVLMAVRGRTEPGNPGHVVAVRPLYGGTDHLIASGMLGLDVSWVRSEGIREALRPDTGLVMLETPANPTLALVDLEQVVEQAGTVPVMVDNTFATPVLQNPAQQGAAFVLHSATKFIGGHGDVLAGVVASNEEWARELRKVRVITGNVLHPMAAYLLHRGLPTLPIRVRQAQEGARFLVERLRGHPKAEAVFFPGSGGPLEQAILEKQMKGPGAVFAFILGGGFQAASRLMAAVELMTPAVSLGSVDTLIQHPAGLTHRVVEAGARNGAGICDGLIRISVGLEDPADLWADLEAALEKV